MQASQPPAIGASIDPRRDYNDGVGTQLLTQETAHNLILIYNESGAGRLAQCIAARYLAVI